MPIAPGTAAPDFVLGDQHGRAFRLGDLRGRAQVLLVFLPAAFTPICSTELPALAALRDRFWAEAGTLPVAVTVDNAPANLAWARTCGAGDRVPLLSDFHPHGAVARAYGALLEGEGVADRAAVLVDRAGVVRYSESVGKYGKRSAPALLAIATAVRTGAVAGAPGAAPPSARTALDLPVLYAAGSCAACAQVRAMLDATGRSQRVVVRDVEREPDAMRALLALDPAATVPALVWRGARTTGRDAVAARLQAEVPPVGAAPAG